MSSRSALSRTLLRHGRKLAIETVGALLIAISITNFAVPAAFPMVGFSGIAMLLNRLLGVPVGWASLALNIPAALLCFRVLGKDFMLHSLFVIVVSSLMTDYLTPLFPLYTGDRLLACICAGVLAGFGYALVFLQNSSSGGTDFIVMAIRAVRPQFSVGTLNLFFCFVIILSSELFFPDIDGAIYVLMLEFIASRIIDRLLIGFNAGKLALIVTLHAQEICGVIDRAVHRGATILHASGGYLQEERGVVMCACSPREMHALEAAVRAADPASFMVVLDSTEVHGNGFHPLVLGKEPNERDA